MSDANFENLVNEHGRQVLRTALRVLRDASLAHDVHQEVFLAVWRRWDRYNGAVNWPAYLYRATVRKALEMARQRLARPVPARASKEVSRLRLDVSSGDHALHTSHFTLPTSQETPHGVTTSGPDDALQADELQQRLAAALARLPRRQADAFVLTRLEGLAAAEVAAIMGCSEPTVRVHLHRAMIRLARELHEYLGRE